jgi:hypothetical protein
MPKQDVEYFYSIFNLARIVLSLLFFYLVELSKRAANWQIKGFWFSHKNFYWTGEESLYAFSRL